MAEPFVDRHSLGFGQCLIRLERIINDNEICASAGELWFAKITAALKTVPFASAFAWTKWV
jgi:hypothetical protein